MTAEVYKDAKGQWRWRLKAGNARIVADSSESYTRRRDALRALEGVVVGCRGRVPAEAWWWGEERLEREELAVL